MSQHQARTLPVPVRQTTPEPPTPVHSAPDPSIARSASFASAPSAHRELRDAASGTYALDKAEHLDLSGHLLPRLPSVAGLHFQPNTTNTPQAPSGPSHAGPPSGHTRIAELIDSIVEHQEDLRDAREKIIGERVRLRSKRKELKSTREKAAVQAGITIDLVKRYFLETGVLIPRNIQDALEDANSSRDRLGEEELEYEIAEQHYDFAEWEYTEKEQIFVEDVLADGAASCAPNSIFPGTLDTFGLSEQPLVDHEVMESHDDFETTAYQKATFLDLVGAKAITSHVEYSHRAVVSMANDDPSNESRQGVQPSTQHSDDSRQRDVYLRWSNTRRRIEEWLLEHLQLSKYHIALLKAMIPQDLIEGKDFWGLVTRNWSADSPTMIGFHSGDTIASDGAASEPVSVATMHKLLDFASVSGTGTPPTEISNTPLVSLNRGEDALDDVLPREIDTGDLVDVLSEGMTPMDRNTRTSSGSYRYTRSSIFSDVEESSISNSEEDYLYTPSVHASTDTVRIREPSSSVHSMNDDAASDQDCCDSAHVAADPTTANVEHEWTAIATDDIVENQSAEQLQAGNTLEADTESAIELTSQPRAITNGPHYLQPSLLDDQVDKLMTSKLFSPHSSAHPSFAAFIWIEKPKPWALPLLRLVPTSRTSSTVRSASIVIDRVAFLPFVSGPDTLCRLPGPSTLPQLYSDDM